MLGHMSDDAPLPVPREALLARLDKQDIPYDLHAHEPIFTVEEGEHLKASIPGVHCRNLFLRDKKKNMVLITAANETRIDLKKLAPLLDLGRLSFGSADRLWTYLGIRQGSVNPFCIVNDTQNQVRMILDSTIMDHEKMNVHPMDNAYTVGLAPADIVKFIESTDHSAEIVDFTPAMPDE